MNKETQAVVTGAFGGLLVAITVSGRFTAYVRPGFRTVLLTTGVLLIVLAVVTIAVILRDETRRPAVDPVGAPDGAPVPEPLGDPHAGHRHGSRAPWLLVAPVLVLLLVAPPALGVDAASRGIECGDPSPDGAPYASRRTEAADPLPPGSPVPLTMQEFTSRSLYDAAYSTANVDINVVAFITESPCDGDGYSLVRLKISCCAADAFPLRAHVDGPAPYPVGTWVQAVIRAVRDTGDESDNYVPTATVSVLRPVPQPADPYETT